MENKFQQASEKVLVVLRNARNIATVHQNRRQAKDVLRALALYVQGTGFPCKPDIFEKLSVSITDKSTPAIIEEFDKVENDLLNSFNSSTVKKPKNIIDLLR